MRALIIENNQVYRDTLAQQGFATDSGDSIESARLFADSESYNIICVKLTGCHNRHSLMEFSEKFI